MNRYLDSLALGGTNFIGFYDARKGSKRSYDFKYHYVNLYGMKYTSSNYLALGYDSNIVVVDLATKKKVLDSSQPVSFIWGIDEVEKRLILTGGGTGFVRLWNYKKQVREYKSHTSGCRGVCSIRSTNGEYFASVGNDAQLVIYNTRKPSFTKKMTFSGQMYGVDEDYYRKRVYCAGYTSRKLFSYDLREKKEKNDFSVQTGYLWCVRCNPKDNKVYTGDSTGTVACYDTRKGGSSAISSQKLHTTAIYRISLLSHNMMASTDSNRKCIIYDRPKFKIRHTINSTAYLYGMEYIPKTRGGPLYYGDFDFERISKKEVDERMARMESFKKMEDKIAEGQVCVETGKKRIKIWKCFLLNSNRHRPDRHMKVLKLDRKLEIEEKIIEQTLYIPNFRFAIFDVSGEEDLMNPKYPIAHLDDYYYFFRELGIQGEVRKVVKELQSIKSLDMIVFLFINCVKKYESAFIQRKFFPTRGQKKLSFLESLEEEVKVADQKLKQKKLYERNFDDSDDDDDSSDSSEEEEEFGSRRIRFSTCFARAAFNIMKTNEEEILRKSSLLKLCIHFLEEFKGYDPHSEKNRVRNHSDLRGCSKKSGLEDTLELLWETKELSNVNVVSNDREIFPCHLEVLLLNSPFFNRMLLKTACLKKEKGDKKYTLFCGQINKMEMLCLLEFIYTGVITENTCSSSEKLQYIIKLMIFASMFKDTNLLKGLNDFLFKYFKRRKKSDFESFLLNCGHLLEDDNLMNQFVKSMAANVVFKNGKVVDETKVEDLLQKSVRIFKVESVLKGLKRDYGILENENESLKKEQKSLIKKVEKLEKSI